MGRRSSRPSPPRRAPASAAPRRPSSSRATAAAPAAPQKKPAPPPPAPVAAAPPAPAPSPTQGGSAMGGFMANVASTAAGVAIGRGIDRALFGGGSSHPAPTDANDLASHDPAAPAPAYAPAADYDASGFQEHIPDAVCSREISEFKKCLERSGNQIAECQWNFDLLSQCQAQAAQNAGFASAPRL